MSIFQKSVVNKYLKNLDEQIVQQAFDRFNTFYGNKLRLHNIIQLKEENYQEGFLREIFVNVLGYTINPDLNFDLTTEYKNQTDSKKADGAIIKDSQAIGVIELKSTKTAFIESITNQAFNYKHNQPNCRYVITSNFHHLRFYIDNSTEYEEFDLFELSFEEFKHLYLFLSKESIYNEIPSKLKDETKFHEENITDKFYRDYKQFRDKIFHNLVKNNPTYDKLTLFKKTQKLLDRFIFIWFAEDCGLVAPNLIANTIQKWKTLLNADEYFTLFSRFQKAFHYLNVGYVFQNTIYPAFNGGLFKKDEIIDNTNLKIDDDILLNDCLKISAYDFSTDLDINILGHIFEHSLNEIEEIAAELTGESFEKSNTKRKKDGIFYTPKFITNYIVENTVGKLCKEKLSELHISNITINEVYKKKDKLTSEGNELYIKFQEYKNWLLSLKILDPACGSGAFLNAALEFLINEHRQIDELIYDLKGNRIQIVDMDKSILENNIFGVDINEESVEIAKLSLWLRTAQRDRTLSDLTNNIKCGNSLIDNPEIAFENSFSWSKEFPEIMQNGGFNVIIGNPPYVNNKEIRNKGDFKNYRVSVLQYDLYSLFIERSLTLLRENGYHSFIVPDSIFGRSNFAEVRKMLLEYNLISVFQLDEVFAEANVSSCIYVVCKNKNEIIPTLKFTKAKNILQYSTIDFKTVSIEKNKIKRNGHKILFVNNENYDLVFKLNSHKLVSEIVHIWRGEEIGKKSEIISTQNNSNNYQLITGENVSRYYFKNLNSFIDKENISKNIENYEKEKIVIRQLGEKINANFDNTKGVTVQSVYNLIITNNNFNIKYVLCVLNSKVIQFIYETLYAEKQIFPRILLENIKELAIPEISLVDQKPFIEKADLMISLNQELQNKIEKFAKRLKSNFTNINITTKLLDFYKFDFKAFISEIKKQKIDFNLRLQDEWEEYFENYKNEIIELLQKINSTDNEIDMLVYKIYNLSTEEIDLIDTVN